MMIKYLNLLLLILSYLYLLTLMITSITFRDMDALLYFRDRPF